MVTHIVMIKFKDMENRDEIIDKAKDMILSLKESVPTLLSMEVGKNFSDEERAMDLVLISEFENREGLDEYAIHPEHLKVIDFIKENAQYSKVVDYYK